MGEMGVGFDGRKWVNTHKKETIQLVGADQKVYIFLATRASKTRFWAPKSRLDFHGLFASYVALFPGGVYMEIESLRFDF